MSERKLQIEEKALKCITRILQGVIYEENFFFACRYCEHFSECLSSKKAGGVTYFQVARKKLWEATGLYMDVMYNPATPERFLNYNRTFSAKLGMIYGYITI